MVMWSSGGLSAEVVSAEASGVDDSITPGTGFCCGVEVVRFGEVGDAVVDESATASVETSVDAVDDGVDDAVEVPLSDGAGLVGSVGVGVRVTSGPEVFCDPSVGTAVALSDGSGTLVFDAVAG
ncbi:MAG TPA: hypothetical protein VIS06_17445, partial [Mycobacteriales bacterium]